MGAEQHQESTQDHHSDEPSTPQEHPDLPAPGWVYSRTVAGQLLLIEVPREGITGAMHGALPYSTR